MTPRESMECIRVLVEQLIADRKALGLSQTEMSRRACMGRNTIHNAEAGNHQPSLMAIIRWAEALGWDVRLVKRGTHERPQG